MVERSFSLEIAGFSRVDSWLVSAPVLPSNQNEAAKAGSTQVIDASHKRRRRERLPIGRGVDLRAQPVLF